MTTDPTPRRPLLTRRPVWVMLLLLLVTLFGVRALLPTRRLHVENFGRVRPGMTREEVAALLGGPPGHYGSNLGSIAMSLEYEGPGPQAQEVDWTDDDNQLEVFFGGDGRVLSTHKRAGYHRGPLSDDIIGAVKRWLRPPGPRSSPPSSRAAR